MHIITSKYIFINNQLTENKAILIDNNQIIDIINKDSLANLHQPIKDYGNGVITPGFIDLQLNGCGGVLFNDDISFGTLETIYQTCLRFGTTQFLPTLITSPINDIFSALDLVKAWFEQYGNNRGVIGIHLEGPFISKDKKGIHPDEFIIAPNDDILKKIVSYTKYFPIKMTIATEVFTTSQIKFLAQNKIILSQGHSNASYEESIAGFNAGIKTVTHAFNAMSGLTGRNPGVIGAVLNSKIYAGIIVDLLHVDPANVELINKNKPNQVYLVTDAVTPTGTNMTTFNFAGKELFVKDGKCIDKDGTLGGANLTLNDAIKYCVNKCNISLVDALKMASEIPAQLMQLDTLGKIAPNCHASLIYMDLITFECKVCTNLIN